MKISRLFFVWTMSCVLMSVVSCSKDSVSLPDEPEPPVTPEQPITPDKPTEPEVTNDTVEVRLGYALDVKVEDLYPSRAQLAGKDLIGINVNKGNVIGGIWQAGYAAAVFDDVSKMVLKLVKGQTYHFCVKYVPNAKDYVYNYPNGSFGQPFRNTLYDEYNDYKVNEVYYDNGIYPTGGYNGPWLCELHYPTYQTTKSMDTRDREYLNIPHYYGVLAVKIDENTKNIEIPLTLCQFGLTLNIDNFTDGKIRAFTFMGKDVTFTFEPNKENKTIVSCIGKQVSEFGEVIPNRCDLRLYYDSPDGKSYLLGTSSLEYEPGKNYVYSFNLGAQEDGSASIILPEAKEFEDVEKRFE